MKNKTSERSYILKVVKIGSRRGVTSGFEGATKALVQHGRNK